MAKFFSNKVQASQLSQSEILAQKYQRARHNLLLIVVFTFINIILLVTNSNTYFLFSATIPYYLADLGMFLCGKYPEDYYWGLEGMELLDNSFLVVMLVIAAVIILLYLLSWIFCKKPRVGWMIFALVFFALDTLGMLWLTGISSDAIIDVVFHAWVIISLISGIISYFKLKKLPDEPMEEPVEALVAEQPPVEVE